MASHQIFIGFCLAYGAIGIGCAAFVVRRRVESRRRAGMPLLRTSDRWDPVVAAAVVLWPIVFPVYLAARKDDDAVQREYETIASTESGLSIPRRRVRWSTTLFLLAVIFSGLWVFEYETGWTPPDKRHLAQHATSTELTITLLIAIFSLAFGSFAKAFEEDR